MSFREPKHQTVSSPLAVRRLGALLRLFALLALFMNSTPGVLFAANPALQIGVTDTLATAVSGQLVTYTVQVHNADAVALSNVQVRLQISPNVTFVSASDSPTDLTGGLYQWTIASLASGATAFRYLSVTINPSLAEGTIITTNAEADQAGDTTANSASDTTTIQAPTVVLTPNGLTFGLQQVGTTSAPQQVTLTNNGSQLLTFNSIAASTGFTVSNNTCVSPIAAGANCTFDVSFAPTSAGATNGTLSVTDNAAGSPHSIPLDGTGTQPDITLTPNPLDFGTQLVGTTSGSQTVTLRNSGNAPLTITSITPNGAEFAQSNDCPTTPATIAVNGTCTFTITFTPSATGGRSGSITIAANTAAGTHTLSLTGTGIQPGIQVNPTTLNFGNQSVGITSGVQSVTVTNNGSAPLTFSSITPSGDFVVAGTGTCGTTLAASASCTIDVTFTPTLIGLRNGNLTITTNAPGGPQVVALSGTGTSPAVQITPSSLDFGSLAVGTPSSPQTVTITNTGNVALTFSSIAANNDFAATDTCPDSPATLAPNTSCTVDVIFTPTTMGTRNGTLTFSDDAPGSTQTVSLTGVGLQAILTASPASHDFGNQRINTSSSVQQFTLTNTGNQSLALSGISSTNGEFSQTNNCPAALAANAGCTISVTFTPTAIGARSGKIQVANDTSVNPVEITLTGTGTNPQANLSAVSLDFGNQQVSTTSATQVITLTNGGTGPLNISNIAISGDYAQTNNCPSTLAQAAICTFNVTFHPTVINTRPGTLTITSDATGSPHSVTLTGIGIVPVVSLNPTSMDFSSIAVNTTSPTQVITLTNTGSQPLVITSITTNGDFAQTNTCPTSPAALAIGANCLITVSFTPQSVGSLNGALVINSNAPSSPHTLTLTGIGTGAVYTSVPAPGTITMSSLIGASNTISITISNDGNQTLSVTGPSESVNAPFNLSGSRAFGIQPSGADEIMGVSCAPTSVGPFTQKLTYTTNDPTKPSVVYTVVCTGTNTATAGYSSSPTPGSSWTVGSVPVGSSATSDLVISESGTAALTIGLNGGSTATAITGPNASDFTLVTPTIFPMTIPDGGALQRVSVRCQPSSVGTRTATLTLTTNDPGQPTVSYTLTCTGQTTNGQYVAYLPFLFKAPTALPASQPDLMTSVSISPSSVAAGQPVVISVTVTNQGTAGASEFWVDLYINPTSPPTAANQPWNGRCSLDPCYGIAWYVTQTVAPGQSVTLTSQSGSYFADNTIWEGSFAAGTTDLYAYADSWNPTVNDGAISESDESNNRGELHGLNVSGTNAALSTTRRADDVPTRPTHPGR